MYSFNEERHIHSLDGVPLYGTTTIIGEIAKVLTWWAAGLAMAKFGWRDPKKNKKEVVETAAVEGFNRMKEISLEDYKGLLDAGYRAHSKVLNEKAEAGTDMHEELENYVKAKMRGEKYELPEKLKSFADWSDKNVAKFLLSEAHCYSKVWWVGGVCDCLAEMKNGEIAIIDFKSTPVAYDTQAFQCAGYDIQISENGAYTKNGEKIFALPAPIRSYYVVPFGAENPVPTEFRGVEGCKEAFIGAVMIHRQRERMKGEKKRSVERAVKARIIKGRTLSKTK